MRAVKLGIAAAALVWAQAASADTVTDWWELANRYYNAGQGAPGPRNPDKERASSRTALAMFEAVNAIDRRYQSYLDFPAGDPQASQDAAAATAAYKVLLHHYPANKTALEESYLMVMEPIADRAAREAGNAIGEKAAAAAIAAGGIDPAIPQPPYRPRTVPGEWVGAACGAHRCPTPIPSPSDSRAGTKWCSRSRTPACTAASITASPTRPARRSAERRRASSSTA